MYCGSLPRPLCQWRVPREVTRRFAMGHGGQVTPAEYMKCVDALKPDIFTLLSDELPAYSNPRKQQTAVERTRTVRTHLPKR